MSDPGRITAELGTLVYRLAVLGLLMTLVLKH